MGSSNGVSSNGSSGNVCDWLSSYSLGFDWIPLGMDAGGPGPGGSSGGGSGVSSSMGGGVGAVDGGGGGSSRRREVGGGGSGGVGEGGDGEEGGVGAGLRRGGGAADDAKPLLVSANPCYGKDTLLYTWYIFSLLILFFFVFFTKDHFSLQLYSYDGGNTVIRT